MILLISSYINWLNFMANVGKYSIHGAYGIYISMLGCLPCDSQHIVSTRIITFLGSGIPINLHLRLLLGRGTTQDFCRRLHRKVSHQPQQLISGEDLELPKDRIHLTTAEI